MEDVTAKHLLAYPGSFGFCLCFFLSGGGLAGTLNLFGTKDR